MRLYQGKRAVVGYAVAAAALVLFGLSAYMLYSTGEANGRQSTDTRSQCRFTASCTAENPTGLMLALDVYPGPNETATGLNDSLWVEVTVFNPTNDTVTLKAANDWYLTSLQLPLTWDCGGGIPYGIAAFEGYYTLQNVTAARGALIDGYGGPIWCDSEENTTSTYSVAPASFLIPRPFLLLAGDYTLTALPAAGAESGNATAGGSPPGGTPVVYTLVAGDEWGDFTLLHFTITLQGESNLTVSG